MDHIRIGSQWNFMTSQMEKRLHVRRYEAHENKDGYARSSRGLGYAS